MSEIKPALTADEWHKVVNDDFAHLERGEHWWMGGSNFAIGSKGGMGVGISPDILHALAATFLYGQPYGFTQEDVEACGAGITALYGNCAGRCMGPTFEACGCDAKVDRLAALSSRIAALLPPTTP